jgi:hypothetical protein
MRKRLGKGLPIRRRESPTIVWPLSFLPSLPSLHPPSYPFS